MFNGVIGNDRIKCYLQRLASKNAIANSLLFSGPEGIGKTLFAIKLAESLLGSPNHPDIRIYRPEGKLGIHPIESMRQFSEDVYMSPFQGNRKLFIIQDAERMLSYSANALLKTFEEPALDSIIILVTSAPSQLLPTILSRCWKISFQSLSHDEIVQFLKHERKLDETAADRIASLANGSIGNALQLLEQGSDAIRGLTLEYLEKGKACSYQDIRATAEAVSEKIEESKKRLEDSFKAELLNGKVQNLSASQKENLEKEIEGVLALRQMQLLQLLFNVILGWYRDLSLISIGANPRFLMHKDRSESLEQALQRGEMLSLENVQKALADAKLSAERSTTLSILLESLFLKINQFC